MLRIDGIPVEEEIITSHFLCDLVKCKGACCTFPGDFGAPVKDDEVKLIRDSMNAAMKYLSERTVRYIEKYGCIEGDFGNLTTVCIDKKDCVFVFYDGDIAKCALEKAYLNGESIFRKPVSCHLFPIRVGKFGDMRLFYEKISECKPAIENGKKAGVRIFEVVKDALIRRFGNSWYEALKQKASELI